MKIKKLYVLTQLPKMTKFTFKFGTTDDQTYSGLLKDKYAKYSMLIPAEKCNSMIINQKPVWCQ